MLAAGFRMTEGTMNNDDPDRALKLAIRNAAQITAVKAAFMIIARTIVDSHRPDEAERIIAEIEAISLSIKPEGPKPLSYAREIEAYAGAFSDQIDEVVRFLRRT